MKKLLLLLLAACEMAVASAQSYTASPENLANRKLFQDNKFGMFIHWGASSVLGNGEWVMNNRNIPVAQYSKLINLFNPQHFDAKKWVGLAKSAGMKYITFITRHHDGFSNWDTQASDWKITNTPYGKDALKQLAEECRKQGMPLFCYYSLLDWYRSDYQYETGRTGQHTGRTAKSDWESYIKFMKAQLTELLTQYGPIAGIWFDGHWDQLDNDQDTKASKVNWHYDEIYALIHQLQPGCLISNNHHQSTKPGEDFQAFEKDLPGHNTTSFGGAPISSLPLETCETMNDSWGFNITDTRFKTVKALIHYLVKAGGYNANFLLNVGPMPDGTIQQEFADTLAAVGKWIKQNGEAIYGTRGGIVAPQSWGVLTAKNNLVYVHLLNAPPDKGYIFIPGYTAKIKKASLFNASQTFTFKQQPEGTFVYIDGLVLDETDTIIQLEK